MSLELNLTTEAYRQAKANGVLDNYWKRRWQRAAEMAGWLSEANLPSLTLEQGLALYRASGGRRSKVFASNSPEDIRDSLDFLLYDTIILEARFNECVAAEGSYQLAGAGKEFASYLLCLRNPTLFALWNPTAERALRQLKLYPKTLAKGHWGLRYLDLLDAMQQIRFQYKLTDYREVDEFGCFIDYFIRRRAGGYDQT